MINCSDRASMVTVLFFQQVKLFWKMSRGKVFSWESTPRDSIACNSNNNLK